MPALSFFDRENTVAPAGYSRWLVPPAALAVHLSIGQAYALSVFNNPLQKHDASWDKTTTVWIFNIAFVFLGLSAAVFGKWLEKAGPRKAMFVSALCFCGGFFISAIGIYFHIIWLLYLGSGVLGGIGLGLGYISPVSTLIKWFPDRPGMATGMAIMGFGGGALIGSPLADNLMKTFATTTSVGIWETFATMGAIYFVLMMFGVFTVRVPPQDWKPEGYAAPVKQADSMITTANVSADEAIKTPQFWFLWIVLFLNVTAGIGILAQASPLIQAVFADRFAKPGLSTDDITKSAAAAGAGFVGLISLFNLVGRFFWSSISDYIGRKPTYMIYLGLGCLLFATLPTLGASGNLALFVGVCCVILSMYGGGFATVPAYLRDMFGTYQVGAIHGRLLTAWSMAAIVGPSIVTYLIASETSKTGVDSNGVYTAMYIMSGLLIIGFISNLLVRPVDPKHYHKAETTPNYEPNQTQIQDSARV